MVSCPLELITQMSVIAESVGLECRIRVSAQVNVNNIFLGGVLKHINI